MHLCPLALNIQPILADYDHSLRLYPLPTAVSDACAHPPPIIELTTLYYEACVGG